MRIGRNTLKSTWTFSAYRQSTNIAIVSLILIGILVVAVLAVSLYFAPAVTAIGLAVIGIGIPFVLLIWFRPEFGLLVLVFLVVSLIPADIIDIRLPIGGLELRDLALLGMAGLLILQGLIRKTLVIPLGSIGIPLLIFLGFAIFSTVYALFYQNVEFNWVFSELRILVFYCVFFVTGWAITRGRQLSILLIGLFIIADLITGVLFLQQYLGPNHPLLSAMSYSNWRIYEIQQVSNAGIFGVVRIMPPGVLLPYFMMLMAFCLMVIPQRKQLLRSIYGFQFLYLNVGLLLTYTRALWFATAMAIGLVLIIRFLRDKDRIIRYITIGVAIFLLLSAVLGSQFFRGKSFMFDNPFIERFLSIATPEETFSSNSLQARVFETEQGLRCIFEHPLVGVGLGNAYRELSTFQGEARGWRTSGSLEEGTISRYTRFLHNSYLYIAVKMGLPALACFLWFYIALAVKSGQLYKYLSDGPTKGVVLAVLTGFLGLLLWAVFHEHFMKAESAAIIGLMAGLIVCIQKFPNG